MPVRTNKARVSCILANHHVVCLITGSWQDSLDQKRPPYCFLDYVIRVALAVYGSLPLLLTQYLQPPFSSSKTTELYIKLPLGHTLRGGV